MIHADASSPPAARLLGLRVSGRILAPAALLLVALCVALGWRAGAARVWSALLLLDVYVLSLALGGIVFVAIQLLTHAGWWVVLRRIPEALGGLLPVAALFTLPLYFGRAVLYSWSRPEASRDALIAAKRAYLNTPFFFLRLVLILALWTLFSILLRRLALRAEREGEEGALGHRRLARLAAVFIPVFAVTWSVASFDWLMSLDPRWYSTIFAVYCFAGLFLSAIAAVTLIVALLAQRGGFGGALRDSHLHDLGKLLFAFSVFWAYIWASQYLLIWYSDIPAEVTFYTARTSGPWAVWFFAAFALEWLLPFLVLLPRAAKRNPKVLAAVALAVLAGHWVDLYVQIGPPVLGTPRAGLFEILLALAFALLFAALFLRALNRTPLVPARDPYLAESLAHHG